MISLRPPSIKHILIFFFDLAMLDIIENDLLEKHLPKVSYLRLDGSIPANMRHEIVANFNNDPSIDILLLTTQVRQPFASILMPS